MTVLFWTLWAMIGWAYLGYPLAIRALAALLGRRPAAVDGHEPTVSVLIPAFNEEPIIARKIENALALDYPPARREILVASGSDDGTDSIVARYADMGVRLISSPVGQGKVGNLARAIPESTGEILVFTDANAMLRPDALRRLVRNFADPAVGSVSGRLVYEDLAGAGSERGERAYWSFEMMVKGAESRLGALPGANGSLFALRRDLYRPISERRGDDFELPVRVILQGFDSILEPEAVSVEGTAASYRDEYRRKVRIINWMLTSALILIGEAARGGRWLIAFQLLSHKLVRWAVPFFLLALLPVSVWLAPRGGIYLVALIGQAALYLAALLGSALLAVGTRLPGALALPVYFAVVNAAAAIGVATCLAGREVKWHKRVDRLS